MRNDSCSGAVGEPRRCDRISKIAVLLCSLTGLMSGGATTSIDMQTDVSIYFYMYTQSQTYTLISACRSSMHSLSSYHCFCIDRVQDAFIHMEDNDQKPGSDVDMPQYSGFCTVYVLQLSYSGFSKPGLGFLKSGYSKILIIGHVNTLSVVCA